MCIQEPLVRPLHAVHRLVQHMLQVVGMAWTYDSTPAIFFYMRYQLVSCPARKKSEENPLIFPAGYKTSYL